MTVKTPANNRGYKIALHSDQTVMALQHTYDVLKAYLAANPQYNRGVAACSNDAMTAFATKFASIANFVPADGQPSGAKLRSDLADGLFQSDTCTF